MQVYQSLVAGCGQLLCIDLGDCDQVTDAGISALVAGCGQLMSIDIGKMNNNSDIGTKRLDFPLFNHLTFPLTDRTLRPKVQREKTEKK